MFMLEIEKIWYLVTGVQAPENCWFASAQPHAGKWLAEKTASE